MGKRGHTSARMKLGASGNQVTGQPAHAGRVLADQEIEARLEAIASPFRNAHAMDIENLIDPRDTRPLLAEFVRAAQPVLETQLGPTPGPSYRP